MKPRVKLTVEQLRNVGELREAGHSWSSIGRELGINRQIVKREYSNWEKDQVPTELQAVRHEGTADEFRKHLDMLLALAQELSGQLEQAVGALSSQFLADGVFVPVLDSERPVDGTDDGSGSSRVRRMNRRRRRWLFDALQAHLGGTDWIERYEGWTKQCDARASVYGRVEQLACECLTQCLRGRAKTDDDEQSIQSLTTTIASMAWQMLEDARHRADNSDELGAVWGEIVEEFQEALDSIKVIREEDCWSLQLLDQQVNLSVHNPSEAHRLEEACRQDMRSFIQALGAELDEAVESINGVEDYLEELLKHLDPLVLRPLLFKTRCELCPV